MRRMLEIQPLELTLYDYNSNKGATPVEVASTWNRSFVIGNRIYIDYQVNLNAAVTPKAFAGKALGIKVPGRFYDEKTAPSMLQYNFEITAYSSAGLGSPYKALARIANRSFYNEYNTDSAFFANPYLLLYLYFGSNNGSATFTEYRISGWIDAEEWTITPKWAMTKIYNTAGLNDLINTTTGVSYDESYDTTKWYIEDVKGKWVMKDPNGQVTDPADFGLSVEFMYENGKAETTAATWNDTLRQYELEITEDMYIGPNGAKPVKITLSTY